MTLAVKPQAITGSKKGSKLGVLLGVAIGMTLAGLPLLNKKLYAKEQELAGMRDAKYADPQEIKAEARNSRMSLSRGGDKLE